MRGRALLAVMLLAVTATTPAGAVIGTADNVPAATLLFPYFEVDTAAPGGLTTQLTIQNPGPSPTLAHVTLWTDLGIRTILFDVLLVGFGQVTVDLGELFNNGNLPIPPVSPMGNCSLVLPSTNPALSPALRAFVVAAHTGEPVALVFPGLCAGLDTGDGIARGYVTIDAVSDCSLLAPGDPGYFADDGTGVAIDDNVLVGSYLIIDPANRAMVADLAVAVEASATDPLTTDDGDYTFYGRLVGASAVDHREALPNAWAALYVDGAASGLRVWRDPGVDVAPFTCGSLPPPYPLTDSQTLAFDAAETSTVAAPGDHFPWASSRRSLSSDVPVFAKEGWLALNLNLAAANAAFGQTRQSWVTVSWRGAGRFAALRPATQLGNAGRGDDPVIPPPGAP